LARRYGLKDEKNGWRIEPELLGTLEHAWKEPDEGIWEVRGPRRHFTHSKVMAWVAFDRAVKDVKKYGMKGHDGRWAELRDQIHAEVCERGFDRELNSFVQSYGSKCLDASLLVMPQVGFLPADDPRIVGTVRAIERHLMHGDFVKRYNSKGDVDGMPW